MSKAVVAAGLGFTVSAVVGCGSSGDLLSTAQASALRTQLNRASAALRNGECGTAAGYISDFQTEVNDLGSVSQTLINNLQAGATKIENLAAQDCPTNTTPPTTHTTTTHHHTPPPHTTPTVTTNTDTDTTTTSTTTTTTTTTTTNTNTGTYSTPTQTETGTTSTQSYTQPGLTGPSTTSSTSSTQTSPLSGGGGLAGGAASVNSQRRGYYGLRGNGYGQGYGNGYGDGHQDDGWHGQEGGS